MKKGRFLWSAHRITERQKAGKARNIKEKRQSKNFNTASKPPVVRRSSASVKKVIFYPGKLRFSGVFLYLLFGYLNLWGLIFEEIDRNMLRSDEN